MGGKTKAPSLEVAPDGVTPARNGLGPERVLEIQRARILAAMVEVSGERGAANVSVAHVVERAGVSRRTFYELFADREACFLAAFDDAIARASRYVLDAYDPDAKWVERVRTALTAFLQFLDVERGAGQLMIVGSLGAGHHALERRRRGIAQIIALIDQGRAESKAGDELPPLTAEGIVGGVLSILHSRLLDSPSLPTMRGPGTGPPPSPEGDSPLGLCGPLMSMIVLPYLGLPPRAGSSRGPLHPRRVCPLRPDQILCANWGCASPIARSASCSPSPPSPAAQTGRSRTALGSATRARSPSC